MVFSQSLRTEKFADFGMIVQPKLHDHPKIGGFPGSRI
jgi:hypothetical protein